MMSSSIRSSIILLLSITCCSGFFFDLPGITAPKQQCCCPQPSGYAPPPPPSGYVPPASGYVPYRRKRTSPSGELEASSTDELCNSVALRNSMKKGLVDADEKASREGIHTQIKADLNSEMAVICTAHPFDFTVSHDAEYCSVDGNNFTCYAFVF